MITTAPLVDIEYLGDGVYVGHDDFHTVLWVSGEGAFGPGAIALEPGVLARLDAYRKRVREAGSDPYGGVVDRGLPEMLESMVADDAVPAQYKVAMIRYARSLTPNG